VLGLDSSDRVLPDDECSAKTGCLDGDAPLRRFVACGFVSADRALMPRQEITKRNCDQIIAKTLEDAGMESAFGFLGALNRMGFSMSMEKNLGR
jgi:hypothetical protein